MVVRRLARVLAHRRWFSRLGRTLVPADRLVGRLTGGRVVALRLVPSLLLVTTGRRTGQLRTTPLLTVPDGDAFLVIGSNWGGPRQPAWALNLLAQPDATVVHKGRRIPVRARLLAGDDREQAWQRALREWPAYRVYAARAGREIHMFRLTPRG